MPGMKLSRHNLKTNISYISSLKQKNIFETNKTKSSGILLSLKKL